MQPITLRARNLRKSQTSPESLLWEKVRARQLGYKIVRQKPILIHYFDRKRAFIADFYCHESRMVIEIDGSVHAKQSDYDSIRALLLNQKGLRLVRFTNSEIIKDMDSVLVRIKKELGCTPAN